jgi:hypothetical protein
MNGALLDITGLVVVLFEISKKKLHHDDTAFLGY